MYEEVEHWIVPAFVELCKQQDPPSDDEASLLGLKDTLKLWRIHRGMAQTGHHPNYVNFEEWIRPLVLHDAVIG